MFRPPDLDAFSPKALHSTQDATSTVRSSGDSHCLAPAGLTSVALEILLLFVLVAVNAALSGTEMALVSLRDSQLARLESLGPRGQRVVRLAQDPNRFLSTVQIGLTLGGFLASAVAAVALAKPLVEPLGFLGNAADPVAIVLVTLVLTFVTLVLGELAPKRIAMQRAEGWALRMCGPISVLAKVSRPALWILGKATDVVVRLAGADPMRQREEISTDEIRSMIDTQTDISPGQRQIIEGAFAVQRRVVWNVLVPRVKVVMVAADTAAPDALALLVSERLSRAPVYKADQDDVVGVVHIRELIGASGPVAEVMRAPLVVPESLLVLSALQRMRLERTHIAIVVDEYGGFVGIVTMEDVLEEIVGDIYDEFDLDRRASMREADGAVVVPGDFPAHELERLQVFVEGGDSATVAGIALDAAGHVPEVGDIIEVQGWRFEILGVDQHAITSIRIQRRHAD